MFLRSPGKKLGMKTNHCSPVSSSSDKIAQGKSTVVQPRGGNQWVRTASLCHCNWPSLRNGSLRSLRVVWRFMNLWGKLTRKKKPITKISLRSISPNSKGYHPNIARFGPRVEPFRQVYSIFQENPQAYRNNGFPQPSLLPRRVRSLPHRGSPLLPHRSPRCVESGDGGPVGKVSLGGWGPDFFLGYVVSYPLVN